MASVSLCLVMPSLCEWTFAALVKFCSFVVTVSLVRARFSVKIRVAVIDSFGHVYFCERVHVCFFACS